MTCASATLLRVIDPCALLKAVKAALVGVPPEVAPVRTEPWPSSPKVNSSYVSRLLRLTLLAPDIVEAILDGRQPEGVTLPGLMEPSPVAWERQNTKLPT